MERRALVTIVIGVALLVFAGCGTKPAPEAEPSPAGPSDMGSEGLKEPGATEETPADISRFDDLFRKRTEEEAAEKVTPLPPPPVVILEDVHFEFDKFTLTPEARQVLARHAKALREDPALRIQIEGHCDERGTQEYNLALGQRRAQAAKEYLINSGIEPSRISIISYGEERPLDAGSTEEAWAKNRRAHFNKQ